MPETLEGKRETDKMRAHSYFSMADAAKTAVPHTGCMQGHEEAGRKKKGRWEAGKNGGNKFAATMEAAPSDGRGYSTDSLQSLSLPLAQSLALVRSLQTKIWRGGGRGTGVESGVGGGVGLLKRVIFFFQRGERRTVMCAELMTKGPFMCSVCR